MKRIMVALFATSLMGVATASDWQNTTRNFEVTITNITKEIIFTPLLVATHSSRVATFSLGKPASEQLAIMAEGGDTAPLIALLKASGQALDAVSTGGLLAAGASVTVKVRANGYFDRLSVAGMLLPTNDGFMAINSYDLPWGWHTETVTALGYDAGSEPNDELCANIPGPQCGGAGTSPGVGGEGFVHIHNGVHGIGNLAPDEYDWRNPVAQVTIRRVR